MLTTRRNSVRAMSVAALASVTILLGTGVAEAGSVSSSWGYINNVFGKSYKGYANVGYNQWGGSYFHLQTQNNGNVAAGWMGAQVRTYKESALCDGSSISYNPNAASVETAYGLVKCGAGNYKAQGNAYVWNGNGYNSYASPVTPFVYIPANMSGGATPLTQSDSRAVVPNASDSVQFSRNAKNESFGSAAFATSPAAEPDLIEAVGTNGVKGYVRRTDLEQTAKTPAEATRQSNTDRTILLYASDGSTRIGRFVLHHLVVPASARTGG